MEADTTTSFAPSGEDAITRVLDVKPDETADVLSQDEFDKFYEIERTAEEIQRGDYKRVALQFPDELLHDSVPIYRQLKRRTGDGRDLYVLADTSYGSCCVDEVAAQHVEADAMVHYGHACMSQTSRLPVVYVFGKKALGVEKCVQELVAAFERNQAGSDEDSEKQSKHAILFKHDVVYTHLADTILDRLKCHFSSEGIPVLYHKTLTTTPAPNPLNTAPIAQPRANGANSLDEARDPSPSPTPNVELDHTTIFYVGSESLNLTNILMTNSGSQVISYDPTTQEAILQSSRTNKLLMKRYAIVQKARDADVFGILVGTLGVASYLPLIKHLRTLLSRKQKKSYTISVGKLNPAKLANFMEIECFVLVACPENSLIEAKDFYRPIVTPYELEVALQAEQSWTGKYVLDFGKLLAESTQGSGPLIKGNGGESEEASDPDQPVFSLVTGKYRLAKRYGDKDTESQPTDPGDSSIVLRNQDSSVARIDSAAGQFLQQRTYQGLEQRVGEDAPSVLEQGRSGIARGYQDDRTHQEITD